MAPLWLILIVTFIAIGIVLGYCVYVLKKFGNDREVDDEEIEYKENE